VIVLIPALDWNLRNRRSKASPFTPCSRLRSRAAKTRAAVNRNILKTSTDADKAFVNRLRREVKDPLDLSGKEYSLVSLIRSISKGIGMNLVVLKKQERRDNTRIMLVTDIRLERMLPEVSDHWLVYSVMLGCKVQVGGWHRAHADARNDRLESSLALDPDYGDIFTVLGEHEPLRDENQRYEKLNAKSLQGLLAKYNGIMEDALGKPRNPFVDDAERKLRFLEACDDAAEEADADGERLLLVTYGKRRGIGRRTASYPSMSSCPSSLNTNSFWPP